MLKIIFAPDSFKGTLSSAEQIAILEDTAKKFFKDAQLIGIPIADGGEGTLDALVGVAGGRIETRKVAGPLFEPVEARIGFINDKAVIEMAQASGLPLIPEHLRNPLNTTSFGTGQLILEALESGSRELTIAIGGSATNDGGMGALIALGAKFFDAKGRILKGMGKELEEVSGLDLSEMSPLIKNAKISVICDVKNPLLGPNGATYTYGPQKGADKEMLVRLEKGMENYARIVNKELGTCIDTTPGAGAAGGLGAAIHAVLGGMLRPGIEAVLETVGFEKMLEVADLVITGEGRIDEQSISFGKVVAGIASLCSKKNVPVCVIAGSMKPDAIKLLDICSSSIITSVNAPMTLEDALENASELYESAAMRLFAMLKIGEQIFQNRKK